jgi:hypothetical protein
METARFKAARSPLPISEEEIAEFQALVRQEHGQEITREEAIEGFNRLVAFYKLALGFSEQVTQIPQAVRPKRRPKTKNVPMTAH